MGWEQDEKGEWKGTSREAWRAGHPPPPAVPGCGEGGEDGGKEFDNRGERRREGWKEDTLQSLAWTNLALPGATKRDLPLPRAT